MSSAVDVTSVPPRLILPVVNLPVRLTSENPEIFFELEKKNKSVMFMTSHYGGYEWFLSINYHVPQLPFAVYTPLTNKGLEKLIKKFRLKHGSKLISRYEAGSYIKKQIKENKLFLYGMAADQSAQIRSITYWKEFLGVKVPVFTGSERIAKQHDIPVVFGKVVKIKRGYYKVIVDLISEFPNEFKTPPLMTVGSIFAVEKILEISEVVVVFPCDPATTIFFINDTTCPNISPLE